MPLYRHADRILLMIHIPKTGGSTVEEMLKAAGAAQSLKYHKRLEFSACTPQHMHWALLKFWVGEGFYDDAMTLVRNPFSRLISEYRWRAHVGKSALRPFSEWVPRQFATFKDRPYLMDNHIRPQVEFVSPKTRVFHLEDGLEAPVRHAFETLGLPRRDLPIHHTRKSEHERVTLQPDTIDHIQIFYAKDFKKFGYDPNDIPGEYFHVSN